MFEDGPEREGGGKSCVVKWVVLSEVKASVPKTIVHQRAMRNARVMVTALGNHCLKMKASTQEK